jgi:hypothetical protein
MGIDRAGGSAGAGLLKAIQLAVSEMENYIDPHHNEVDHIKYKNVGDVPGKNFSGDAAEISKKNKAQKNNAFALGGPGFPGFYNACRP